MNSLTEITILRPIWLAAIPIVVGLMVIRLRRAGRPGDWHAHIQPHLLAAMAALGKVDTGSDRVSAAAPFVAAAIIAAALTGPAVERKGAQTFRNLDGVVFVIDVSGSMTRDPIWPAVVNMARGGLSVLGSKPAAMIVYAGDSYLAAPLTIDHTQLGQSVSLLDANTVPDKGNRPALALGMAADVLDAASILSGDVILLTDGDGLDAQAIEAAGRINGLGARLSVVVADTTVSNVPPQTRGTLATMVQMTGGSTYKTDELSRFMGDLGAQGGTRLERQDRQLLLLADFGRCLLILALIPALLFFRREGA